MEITKNDIHLAEKVLLMNGQTFDGERIKFIQNLKNEDLQAVPGSGKTTALLAKLLVLGQKVDFSKGRGILVLSHTNTAVDEIRNKLQPHCPELFEYPNFVGTIQSFVDKFLAQPFYIKNYNKKPNQIDNDNFFNQFKYKFPKNFRIGLENRYKEEDMLKNKLNKIQVSNDKKNLIDVNNKIVDFKIGCNTPTYRQLITFKQNCLINGTLSFSDAYFLANQYIEESSKIIDLIRLRFQYVFVDEFQDMEKHQHDILEKLFAKRSSAEGIYQRVGDPNQAIYSGMSGEPAEWEVRGDLKIEGSNRFGESIANLVNLFSVDNSFQVQGKNTGSKIKPILIVYGNPDEVLPKFCMLIEEYKLDQVKTDNKTPFWAVTRVMLKPKPPNENEINVTQYFPSYSKEQSKTNYKEYYSCLVDYLRYFDTSKKTLEAPRKAILNIIIKILDLLNITDENKKRIAKKEFIEHLVEKDNQLYENFKTKLFQWCKCLVSENPNFSLIHDEIVEYLKTNGQGIFGEDFEFDGSVNEDLKYFLDPNNSIVDTPNSFIKPNKYTDKANTELDIKLGTVHSVKGQTHVATLYLDVWSNKKQCHENIADIFDPQDLFDTSFRLKKGLSEEQKKFAKLLYVAFSRPSHLLCFAVHKSNINNLPEPFTKLFDLIFT